jgi:hypothetical protein
MKLADARTHVSLSGEADEFNASGVGGRLAVRPGPGRVARGRGGVPEGGPYGAEAGPGGAG